MVLLGPMMTGTAVSFDSSNLHPVGTKFVRRGSPRQCEVIGYHVEYDTDTEKVSVTYRIRYELVGQVVTTEAPRATVDMAIGPPPSTINKLKKVTA